MIIDLQQIEALAMRALHGLCSDAQAQTAASRCAWLHGAGYNGLGLLNEAVTDESRHADLRPDALGLDLQNVSCVFLADAIEKHVVEQGRIFLRNVRHGLYLLPGSVAGGYGIGCPVDPGFALGGERHKNPYADKLKLAAEQGVEIDDAILKHFEQ
jgi:hypothetical protein